MISNVCHVCSKPATLQTNVATGNWSTPPCLKWVCQEHAGYHTGHGSMKWSEKLPQTVGEFLWCEADLHCWIIGIATVFHVSDYKPDHLPALGKWEGGKRGGSMLYKWDDGTEAVMCFDLEAPSKSPQTGLPEVCGWCEFNGPN